MKIRNNYIKNLTFTQYSFSIGSGEEKEVSEKLGKDLLRNVWITEVTKKSVQIVDEKESLQDENHVEDQLDKETKKKGRPKKIITSEKE